MAPFFLLAILPIFAHSAFDSGEFAALTQAQRQSLQNFAEEARLARKLPPCESLDRIAEVIRPQPPPLFCPETAAIYEGVKKLNTEFREDCREISRKISDFYRARTDFNDAKIDALRDELTRRKNGFNLKMERLPEGPEENSPELANAECAFYFSITLDLRMWQTREANEHYSRIDSSLDSIRPPSSGAGEEYLLYLDKGNPDG